MKKILLLAVFTVLSLTTNAQNFKNDGKPYSSYCIITNYIDSWIQIKGLGLQYFKDLYDEKGEKVKATNDADALTYMSKWGWEFVSISIDNNSKCFILKKTVNNDNEAKEGLYFKSDFKK